jgi:hypothetical protein
MADTPAKKDPSELSLRDMLGAQHPLHGAFANVYERMGGEDQLLTWAEENQGEFYKMLVKLAPPPVQKGASGHLSVVINTALQPSALDAGPGVTLEHTPDG